MIRYNIYVKISQSIQIMSTFCNHPFVCQIFLVSTLELELHTNGFFILLFVTSYLSHLIRRKYVIVQGEFLSDATCMYEHCFGLLPV